MMSSHVESQSGLRKLLIAICSVVMMTMFSGCGGGGSGGSSSSSSSTSSSTSSSSGSSSSSSSSSSGSSGGSAANIGINIGSALDWEPNRMFADVMKTSRNWMDTSASTALTALDADGWPQQDAAIPVWHGIDQMNGTYALSFTGKATVAASWGSATVTNQAYDAGTNQTTAKLVYNSTDGSGLLLTFTNTQRTNSSATNTGITNVVLKRPTTVGGSQAYTTEVFNTPFINALSSFSVLRAMDFTATNSNPVVNWSDRTRPGHASQAVGNTTIAAGGWQGRGGAWEYMVLLANQTGKDLWIDVPVGATDDYITKLARLMKYGSDGTNPYTSTQAAPVWPGLAAGRKLYVEFSNEIWNTAGAFEQSRTNHTAAQAEVGAGGSPLNFDGETGDWNWAWRRVAKRTVDISNSFRSVWGDAAMMTQIRPVLMSQLGYPDGPLLQAMHLMMNYYGNPDHVATPHLPNYYVYGLGGSAYYNAGDTSSVNAIFSTMGAGFESALQGDADWALAFGLKRIAYEGGPSFDRTGNGTTDGNLAAAWADSRMTQAMVTQHTTWNRNAGDLLVYFNLATDYQWGFMSDVLTPASPKMSGIAAINAASPAASTYGTAIPATIAASSAAVPPTWAGGGTAMSQRSWLGYPVHVAAAGAFRIALTASAATNGQAEILVDGVSIGTVAVTAGTSQALTTPALTAGSHGIIVRNAAGSFTLSQIQMQAN